MILITANALDDCTVDSNVSKPLHDNPDHDNLDHSPRLPARTCSVLVTSRAPKAPRSCSKAQRKLRFLVDQNNEILEEDMPSYMYPCEEGQEQWLSDEELFLIQKKAASVADFCLDFRPDYAASALSLLSQCAKAPADYMIPEGTSTSVSAFVHGSARGLEHCIVPMLQRRRLQAINAALDAQERLYDLPEDKRWHLVAMHYRRHTRYATAWARMMADGDERARDEM